MAKSDIDFNKIHLHPTFRDFNDWKPQVPNKINGFDTETADGKLFMISFAFDGFAPKVKDGEDLTPEAVFDLLTHKQTRSAHNVWFNLDFDAGVLLSHVLNRKQLELLKITTEIETEIDGIEYGLTYVPGKFLTIRDSNNHKITHYDASQFFYSSLDKAASEWLGKEKLQDADTSRFGLDENRELNQYIKDNYEMIRTYAERDAKLVRDLWREFCEKAVKDDIPINKPFSTGFIAQAYFENHADKKPGFRSNDFQKLAMKTYAGGRFEIFKRGTFDAVTGYDINSAYPYHMVDLPDLDSCKIHYFSEDTTDFDIETLTKFDLGMVRMTVTTNEGKVQPFGIKDGIRQFPRLVDYPIAVTLPELQMALRYDMIHSIDVHEAFTVETVDGTNYPFRYNKELYRLRQQEKAKGNNQRQHLLKIILNSLYGKFIQTTPKRREVDYDYELKSKEIDGEEIYKEKVLQSGQLPRAIEDKRIVEQIESGKLFNPFLASHICALTRIQLVDFIMQNDLEDNLIMFATDCVMVEGDEHDVDEFLGDKLGEWDKEYSGKGFVIAPGVYQVYYGEKDKLKTRGIKPSDVINDLRTYIANYGPKISYEQPLSFKMALHKGEPLSDIGEFQRQTKEIKPNMDTKREWNQSVDWRDLLTESFDSRPLVKLKS